MRKTKGDKKLNEKGKGQAQTSQLRNSIRRLRHDRSMFLVTIVCSDPECIEEREVTVEDLDAVDGYVCECGHGFVVTSVSELDQPGTVVRLPERRPASQRRAA